MGTATRDQQARVFVSKKLVDGQPNAETPGPGTYDGANTHSCENQALSTKTSSTKVSFSKAAKCIPMAEDKAFIPLGQQRVLQGNNSPGPKYMIGDSVADRPNQPHMRPTFGAEPRCAMSAAERNTMANPGPQYELGSALGEQVRGKTNKAFVFGTETRAHRELVQPTHHL
jgi:hypothetical protein